MITNEVASVAKDVGTSATRIVTDTAIDIANVSLVNSTFLLP